MFQKRIQRLLNPSKTPQRALKPFKLLEHENRTRQEKTLCILVRAGTKLDQGFELRSKAGKISAKYIFSEIFGTNFILLLDGAAPKGGSNGIQHGIVPLIVYWVNLVWSFCFRPRFETLSWTGTVRTGWLTFISSDNISENGKQKHLVLCSELLESVNGRNSPGLQVFTFTKFQIPNAEVGIGISKACYKTHTITPLEVN